MIIKVICDVQDFILLKSQWNDIASKSPENCIFMCHEWFDAAWKWLKSDHELFILLASDINGIIGILPLMKKTVKYGVTDFTELKSLTIPDTQKFNIITTQGHSGELIAAFLDYLLVRKDWDRLVLSKIPDIEPLCQIVRYGLASKSLFYQVNSEMVSPSIVVDGNWDGYYSRRTRRLKKGNNYIRNQLNKTGKSCFIEEVGCEKDVVNDIERISSNSWKINTGLTFDNKPPREFLKEIVKSGVENKYLSVWFLNYDGVRIAYELQLRYANEISALRSDYDVNYEELSPGTYLNWKMLEKIFAEKDLIYNMGPGDNQYKYRWAEEYPKLHELTIYNASVFKARMLALWQLRLKTIIKKCISIIKRK